MLAVLSAVVLLHPPPASARVLPPDTRMIEALQAARPSFERCALDSGLAETAFHTLALRIETEGHRVARVVWSQPFVGPRVPPLLACMRTIVRVALRPRRLHVRASVRFTFVPLPDLDFPMQPAPAAPSRVMSAAEAEQLRVELAALPDDAARLARLNAQESAGVAIPTDAVASIEATFRAPDLRVGGALCRVVSGPRALVRVTRGLPGPDARRLRALTRGRCGVAVP
ncbi:MAG: hypothetical protein R3B40_31745 [Polyangiales bacterium]|nr:hypothetical protein [Myxococcales bacterium]MCB9656962.1 hypothetical protein [Sandaracinaceae bacterium]